MTVRIVVLDGATATDALPGEPAPAGEPDWSALSALGSLTVHARTPRPSVVERAAGAQVVVTNKALLLADELSALPDLRFVSVMATGTNVVDSRAARERGVAVSNVPGYSTDSVVQHVFALVLTLLSQPVAHSEAAHARWHESPDFSFRVSPLRELASMTIGVVGLGAIGSAVARVAHALGMRVLALQRGRRRQAQLDFPVQWLDLSTLLALSDVVTLHCPLTDETRGLLDAARIARMRSDAILINTSRGGLIDEAALAAALHRGHLAGVGLDVLAAEPPPAEHPLRNAPRCLLTPHVAWATREARHRLMAVTADNVRAFLSGAPINVVGAT